MNPGDRGYTHSRIASDGLPMVYKRNEPVDVAVTCMSCMSPPVHFLLPLLRRLLPRLLLLLLLRPLQQLLPLCYLDCFLHRRLLGVLHRLHHHQSVVLQPAPNPAIQR